MKTTLEKNMILNMDDMKYIYDRMSYTQQKIMGSCDTMDDAIKTLDISWWVYEFCHSVLHAPMHELEKLVFMSSYSTYRYWDMNHVRDVTITFFNRWPEAEEIIRSGGFTCYWYTMATAGSKFFL